MVTFKLFGPSDGCRRVTWTGIPGLKAINDVADGLVRIPTDKRAFTYIDSEGDRVDIKTDQDVNEAVRDAREAGVKIVKIRIQSRRQWGSRHGSEPLSWCQPGRRSATDKKPCGAARPRGCQRAHWRGSGRGGLHGLWSGFPHTRVKIDLGGADEWADTINTLFSHIFIVDPETSETAGTSNDCEASPRRQGSRGSEDRGRVSTGGNKDDDEVGAVSSSDKSATLPQQSEAPMPPPPPPSHAPTALEDVDEHHVATSTGSKAAQDAAEPQPATSMAAIDQGSDAQPREESAEDYEIVDERDASSVALSASPSDDADESAGGDADAEASAKLRLLRDMGFNLPSSVARSMIEEMGGRMDLIVRALVSNSK